MQISAYPTNGRLPQPTALPIPRAWPGAVYIAPYVYVVGGTMADGGVDGNSNACQRWTPGTPSDWVQLPRMNVPRYELNVVAVGTKIYALGGYNGGALRIVEVFDTAQPPRWVRLSDMPLPRSAAGAAVVDGNVYLLAGIDGSVAADTPGDDRANRQRLAGATSYVYIPPTGQWIQRTPAPEALYGPGCAAIGRKIYLIGGITPGKIDSTNYVFDVDANSWSTISSFNPQLWWPSVVALGGFLYMFGGCLINPLSGRSHSQGLVARYDPGSDQWTQLPNTEIAPRRSAIATTATADTAYAIGGMDCTWKNTAVGSVDALKPADLIFTLFRKT
jgi:N-acetylneuraminic acid mutarotase